MKTTGQCRKGAKCGHYTQVIWGASRELGCGMAAVPTRGRSGSAAITRRGTLSVSPLTEIG